MIGEELTGEAAGHRSAVRLIRVELFREQAKRYAAEREAATLKLERAELLLAMAEEESRSGREFFGPYANNFRAWVKKEAQQALAEENRREDPGVDQPF